MISTTKVLTLITKAADGGTAAVALFLDMTNALDLPSHSSSLSKVRSFSVIDPFYFS